LITKQLIFSNILNYGINRMPWTLYPGARIGSRIFIPILFLFFGIQPILFDILSKLRQFVQFWRKNLNLKYQT
jgi:hypothetical protein